MLNCSDKTIVFSPTLSSESTISVSLYISSLSIDCYGKESQGYVLLSMNMAESEQRLNEIPVVKEYPDIFLVDIPEFPLEREIEFSIDLIPGTGLISISPYKMSPLEIAKLKKQIEERNTLLLTIFIPL